MNIRNAFLVLAITGCNLIQTPPTDVCYESHEWGDERGTYHLPDDGHEPVVLNESRYAPDLVSWNALDTPIKLHAAGQGFPIRIKEGGDSSSGWLGLASVRVDAAGHSTRATVTMNSAVLEQYPRAVAEHVLCQEIGHLLGLGHFRQTDNSCMDDCQGRGAGWLHCLSALASTTPNEHDGEQLRRIYEHAVPGAPPSNSCVGRVIIHKFADGPA